MMCDTLPPKRLKETPSGIMGMNRKTNRNINDDYHDDCFTNRDSIMRYVN